MQAQLVLLFAIAALNVSAQTNSVHNWTLKTGTVFSGDYISSGTQMVVIKASGTNCFLKISNLSTNDWLYFQECKAAQRQHQFATEAAQMRAAGQMEFTRDLIENFPEKVNQQRGWMDCEFLELENIYTSGEEDANLGFAVANKNGDSFYKCVVSKYLPVPGDNTGLQHNPLVEYITGLKRHDKIRLIGTVSAPLGSDYRRFEIEKVEMIEPAAEAEAIKKVKEDLESSQ